MTAVEVEPGQVRELTFAGRQAFITVVAEYAEPGWWVISWDKGTLRRNPSTHFAEALPDECIRFFPLAKEQP